MPNANAETFKQTFALSELVFDRFVLNLDQRLLLCDGEAVDLQPLVFDLLSLLARRARKVVSKSELLPAIWKSASVTESVLARAIMKARRALQDDAQSPQLLRTVPRVGYMLDADVSQRSSHQRHQPLRSPGVLRSNRMAILPAENKTGLTELDWTPQGLMSFLHHWVESNGDIVLVRLREVQDFCLRSPADGDLMRGACTQLGATEAIRAEIWRQDDQFLLRCRRGKTSPGQVFFEEVGHDYLSLAQRLAKQLANHQSLGFHADADPFWRRQIAEIVRLQEAGSPMQALALLEYSVPEIGSSLPLEVLKIRLLCQCNRFQEAHEFIEDVLGRAGDALPQLMRVELLDLRGECLHQCDRLTEAMDSFQQALALSRKVPEAHPLRPDILGRAARVAVRQLNPTAAINLAELAVQEAGGLGQLEAQCRAALWLCEVLSRLDQRYRAQSAIVQAIELGQRSGVPQYEAAAWKQQAALQNALRRNHDAHESMRRSIALWMRCGNEHELGAARLTMLVICMESGRFDEAHLLLEQLNSDQRLPEVHRRFLELARAGLEWRTGCDFEAIERMHGVVRTVGDAVSTTRMVAYSELTMMHIHRGELDEAQKCLLALSDIASQGKLDRRMAAMHLARGERSRTIDLLRQRWRSVKALDMEGFWITVDLTWLLLEDSAVGFQNPELENLFAHVLELSDESTDIQVLKAAYLLRQQPNEHTREGWRQVIAKAPVLARRCPMMTTNSYREAMAARTPPRLTELLSRVCW